MRRIIIASLLALSGNYALADVDAAKAQSIASSHMCFSCHAVDHKVVGPAYQDVAAKYKGNANALAILMKKVKNGGSGVWGPVAMPPNPTISDADLKIVLTWVLAGAPKQ
ncbi:cytochrome C [Burkholderia multivorans]|uniref:c-type cytochrome n=1 Tax=Burkholderia TaxID=32008 RepID=UPI000A1A1741|nr:MULTISPECIES: c-type cytochrome [Burkholderia]ARL04423.1 cytochrome C [Burkholderia pseudomallei]MBU9468722.1 cytochrome C [Burkholderia multivorans]MCA8129649.1 cytochrome C [Burkholderia multivorans]